MMMMDSLSCLSGPDSLSMQEMLDLDIKSEKDLDDLFRDSNFDFQELPAINLDEDSLGAPGENNVWRTSSSEKNWLLGNDINMGISADFSGDESRMVSPYSVMPVTLIQFPCENGLRKVDAALKPFTLKTSNGLKTLTPESVGIFQEKIKEEIIPNVEIKVENVLIEEDEDFGVSRTVIIKSANQVTRNKSREVAVKTASSTPKRSLSVKSGNPKRRLHNFSASDNDLSLTMSAYPKPAYSYSCLIAMALKNSPGGSLPVSEIYNFMCEHFPYFKTAPNGWKNSVRHNLSLNKCFEKIEKPATNGSQRKGCLWAMNPSKIHKMDEEVQKWSKKDKTAIRKSMICPETLEALERGELGAGQLAIEADEYWDHPGLGLKQEEDEDDDIDEEEEEEEEESDDENDEENDSKEYDSELCLSDFDLDEDAMFDHVTPNKVNVRVKVATSPSGSFQPLLSGAYTVNSPGTTDISPKRMKTLAGRTITGNYVYKPLGSLRKKSPMRHSLLSSLEADD